MKDKLSSVEKIKVLEFLKEDKSISEISESLQVTTNIIEGFVDDVKGIVNNTKEELKTGLSTEITSEIINRLKQSGFTIESITSKLNKVMKNFSAEALKLLSVEDVYTLCLNQVSINDVMINKTAGGNTGVAVMTEVAAQKGDKQTKTTKNPAPYIYKMH